MTEHPWYDPDDPRHEEPDWRELLYYEDMGLSRASGVCPSFGRGSEAAPLAGASLARETKEAA